MTPKRLLGIVAAVILGVFVLIFSFDIIEVVDSHEVMVIQYPTGTLKLFTAPGPEWQMFGAVTKYPRRGTFWFSAMDDQGTKNDDAIKIRFNDGAHGWISGSVSYELPFEDAKSFMDIHTRFGSSEAVEQQLIRTVMEKAVYLTGPLMSSKESYSERRNDILRYIEDQMENGIYKTTTRTVQDKDPMTGAPRTIAITEIVRGKDGQPERQDESPIRRFKIRTYNLSLNQIKYEDRVEGQISEQQNALQAVQIAIAKAKEAEQKAITAAKEGEANAATAKWEQEVKKATAVTEAQQKFEVEKLSVATAEQYKKKRILEAEADAEYRRKVMVADGALEQKLKAYVEVQKAYAEAFGKYEGAWVPTIVMGTDSKNGGYRNGASDLINMLSAKTAQELALQVTPKAKVQE